MPIPIRKFKVNFPKGGKEIAARCKVVEFLNTPEGKRVVAEFFAQLKQFSGLRFTETFESAVDHLMNQSDSYWLIASKPLRSAYQRLESDVLDCLNSKLSKVEAIQNVAVCIFWVLHSQNVEI